MPARPVPLARFGHIIAEDPRGVEWRARGRPHPGAAPVAGYIASKVSNTSIEAPPCRTGQPFDMPTAASSESASKIE